MAIAQVHVSGLPSAAVEDGFDEKIQDLLQSLLVGRADNELEILDFKAVRTADGASCRGFGFASFITREAATEAVAIINASRTCLDGGGGDSPIVADLAKPKAKTKAKAKGKGQGPEHQPDSHFRKKRGKSKAKHPESTTNSGKNKRYGYSGGPKTAASILS